MNRTEWEEATSEQRQQFGSSIVNRLPAGFTFDGLHRYELGGCAREVARYQYADRVFVYVPGAEVSLGFNASGWQPTSEELANYEGTAEDYGLDSSIHTHLAKVTLRPRTVTVSSMLAEQEPLGAYALWEEIKRGADAITWKAVGGTVERERKKLLEGFRTGYGSMLAALTEDSWEPYFESLRSKGHNRRGWKVRPPKSVEQWLAKGVDWTPLDNWLKRHALNTERHPIEMAKDDWLQRLIAAEVAAVFAQRKEHSHDPEKIREIAHQEAIQAGEAACVQDVVLFLAGQTDAAGGSAGIDPTQQWRDVVDIHRLAFKGDEFARQLAYAPLVHFDRIDIVPFSE